MNLFMRGVFCCVVGARYKNQAKDLGFLVTEEEKPGLGEIQKFYEKNIKLPLQW